MLRLTVFVFALWSAVGLSSTAQEKKETPKVQLSADELAIVDLTNKERAAKGLKPLTVNPLLCKAAKGHSENMAKTGIFEHEIGGKMAGARTKDAGYQWSVCGENIGQGRAPNWTVKNMMKSWMESKAHAANILQEEFTEIGVAIAKTEKGLPYFTQVFASPDKE